MITINELKPNDILFTKRFINNIEVGVYYLVIEIF